MGIVAAAAIAIAVPGGIAGARGNPGGHGGGGRPTTVGTTEVGNNLSNPAVFAEGVGITGIPAAAATASLPAFKQAWTGLRIPTTTNPTLASGPDGTYLTGTTTYYLQGTEQSSWQAGWINGAGAGPWPAYVKWGDNLVGTLLPSTGGSTPWTTTSTIHVEVAMTGTTPVGSAADLSYFPTKALYGSGNTEAFGTTGTPASAADQHPGIYSDAAYLTIQALTPVGTTPVGTPIHTLATWNRTTEGPSSNALTPEVNASGNVVYSYNWFAGRDHLAPGWYRLSFGVATSRTTPLGSPPVTGNAAIAGVIAPSGTEGVPATPVKCGTAVIVSGSSIPLGCGSTPYGTQSTLDIQLVSGSTGSGGGSGHGGGGGSGGHGGAG